MKSILRTAALALAVFTLGCGGATTEQDKAAEAPKEAPAPVETAVQTSMEKPLICPVSGHEVEAEKATLVSYEGREITLCCEDCVGTFNAEPAKYVALLDKAAGDGHDHEGHDHDGHDH